MVRTVQQARETGRRAGASVFAGITWPDCAGQSCAIPA
jgi:hypothetical protein